VEYTRGWEWGNFLCHGQTKLKKIIKGFQSCLPTLPVYFPFRYKKKIAYTHTQQNKKLRVIVFYFFINDACFDKLVFHRGADVMTRDRGEGD
jgi:hypothetical protein